MESPYTLDLSNKYTKEQVERIESLLPKVRIYFKDIGYYFISSIENKGDYEFRAKIDYWDITADEMIGMNFPMKPPDKTFSINFTKDEDDETLVSKLEKAVEGKSIFGFIRDGIEKLKEIK